MEKRLKIANKLLSNRGVIFISIDDNEQSQLKLLCDEIFGEENSISNISWQRSYSPRNDSKAISNEIEHILVFKKNSWSPEKLPRTKKMNSVYKNPDNDFTLWRTSDAFAPGVSTHQGMVYAIQHPYTGEYIYPYNGACWPLQQEKMFKELSEWAIYRYEDIDDSERRASVCGVQAESVRKGVQAIVLDESLESSKKKVTTRIKEGKWPKFFFTSRGKGGIARKTYLDENSGRVVTNLWLHTDAGHTDQAKKEIKNIFNGEKPFSTPKPVKLVEQILRISFKKDEDITILDFFAGSGTTGHAVAQLNKEDGGNRKYILCTNNENNICEEVTYQRLKNIQGDLPHNLKYYKTEFIPKFDAEESIADSMLEHIKELIELEHHIEIDDKKYIILDDEDEIESALGRVETGGKIFVASGVFLSRSDQRIIEEKAVSLIEIPEYYFREELREVGEL